MLRDPSYYIGKITRRTAGKGGLTVESIEREINRYLLRWLLIKEVPLADYGDLYLAGTCLYNSIGARDEAIKLKKELKKDPRLQEASKLRGLEANVKRIVLASDVGVWKRKNGRSRPKDFGPRLSKTFRVTTFSGKFPSDGLEIVIARESVTARIPAPKSTDSTGVLSQDQGANYSLYVWGKMPFVGTPEFAEFCYTTIRNRRLSYRK